MRLLLFRGSLHCHGCIRQQIAGRLQLAKTPHEAGLVTLRAAAHFEANV
nr:MAG TPA: hypothetical protein [Caudoviricetes sp.]DAS24826.1 MAG TPA: hypothetical protein [Caudoviricetes sp.]